MNTDNQTQKKLEILLVDDDRSILVASQRIVGLLVKERAKGRNCHIELAQDVASALELVKQKDYDLIISDYNMPIKNGVDFYQELKEVKPGQKDKFVFATANADDLKEILRKTDAGSPIPYILEKPVERKEFEKVISLYIK